MAHYYDPSPTAAHDPFEVILRLRGHEFKFRTDKAVFSRHRLDFGSELLINTVLDDSRKLRGRALDLGCGYGPVGIILKRLFPPLDVVLCDINERALALARQNARLNQVQFIDIVRSDILQAVAGDFDLILTNPPIRAGKAVVHRFFLEASTHLKADGTLYVVIQKKQGAPSALKYLAELFTEAEVIERSAGYWVIRAKAPRPTDNPVLPHQPL